jgi:hypothetical protein
VHYKIQTDSQSRAFYLSLQTDADTLFVAFDSKPVENIRSGEPFQPEENESLDWLQAEPAFKELQLLPALIALKKGSPGNLVLPFQEGSLVNFSHQLTNPRDFTLFENSGFTMPFWGVTTEEQSILCLIDYLYARILYRPTEDQLFLIPRILPDPYQIPVRLQFRFLGRGKNYLDLAKTFRAWLQERNELPSLKKKLQQTPQLIHLLEGANAKFPIYMKHEQRPDEQGNVPPPRVYNYQTFEDVVEILQDMKEQGIERMMAVWWGWGKEGYDRLHPDFLPPNPELGGEKAFVEHTQQILDLGFAIGFHDNYTDIYEAAPSFDDGAHCLVGSDGKNRRGGFWAGGQCWLLCSTQG